MPVPKTGADKFGIEHEIKGEQENKRMTDEEIRKKAKHFTQKDNS